MLFLHNTSRVDDEPYPTLLQDHGFGGFPALVVMSADGEKLAQPKDQDVASFRQAVEVSRRYLNLKERAATKPELAKDVFLIELNELGNIAFEDARKAAATFEWTEQERKAVDTALAKLEFAEWADAMGSDPVAAAKRYREFPRDALQDDRSYWGTGLNLAIASQDLEMFDECSKGLLGLLPEDLRGQLGPRIEQARQRLVEALKEPPKKDG